MAKVESFTLDHDAVKAPYVRVAGAETGALGDKLSKFDIRFVQPNQDSIPTSAIHTLEHLLAAYTRDYLEGVIDISPMGSYWLLHDCLGTPSVEEVATAMTKVLNDVLAAKWSDVQGTERVECGNFRDHSLWGAQQYAKDVLEAGFSVDPFERKVLN